VIPFEREPGRSREPHRGSDEGFASARLRRGGVDGALRGSRTAPGAALESIGGWLVAPLLLAATAAAMLLVLRGPDRMFAIAFGLVLALGLAWILVSSLLPAKADRTCPRCSRAALTRLDPRTTQGLRCRACGWRDESASSFLLAEEDGGDLEDIVLRQRRFRRW
jgi:hypothetical protein